MKKIFLFLFLWLILKTVLAQEYKYVPFPDSNAAWSEVYWKPVFTYPLWEYNKYAFFNEDTIINSITYHKLFHTHASDITKTNSTCVGGIREDSLKRVFASTSMFQFSSEIKEVLLYDFSLNEGDTFFNSYASDICTNCLQGDEVISKIDTIKVDNTFRKVYSFDDYNHIIWIEGIGSLQGLLSCWADWPTNGSSNDLVCFHQNDTLLYFYSGWLEDYYDDCVPSFVLNGVPLLPNSDVKVYPNPVTDNFVYFENLDFELLELYDINGCLVLSVDISGMKNYTLDFSTYTDCIYFYRLKTKGLLPTCGKLIKNQ